LWRIETVAASEEGLEIVTPDKSLKRTLVHEGLGRIWDGLLVGLLGFELIWEDQVSTS
jgi:hypothetical protein